MGRFCQFLIKLSAGHTSIFSFPDDNFSKYQWIFTELGMCIDTEETWYGIADGQISSIFDSYLPATCPYFHFWTITLVNINGFSSNLVHALILWRSAFGLLMGKFHPFLTELSVHNTSVFYFQDNNLNKSQWIFTKFGMCIYIVEICFWIAHWRISSIFHRVICPRYDNGGILLFHVLFIFIFFYLFIYLFIFFFFSEKIRPI